MSRRNIAPLSEEQIHKAVIQEVRLRKKPDVVYWHTPNDARRSWGNVARLKAMGMVPGVPDLIFCHNGEISFLEIKAERGRLSDNQKEFHARLAATGFPVMVGYSRDECLSFLSHSDLLR